MWLMTATTAMVQVLAVDLPQPLELGAEPTEITLIAAADTELRRRIRVIAADPAQDLLLRVTQVDAEEPPQVSWEVHVDSADHADHTGTPVLAGVLSLYGAPASAEFVFPLDRAVLTARPVGLKVVFRPTTGLASDGEDLAHKIAAPVRIGAISIEAGAPGNARDR